MLFIPTTPQGGSYNGTLSALDIYTGELLWQNTDSDIGYWDSPPVVVDGVIYINDWNEKTLGIDALTGQTVWERPTGGGTATLAYHDGALYFDCEKDNPQHYYYYCLDTADGASIWVYDYSQHGSSGIADGMLFFGEDESVNDSSRVIALYCETGAEVWSYRTSDLLISSV